MTGDQAMPAALLSRLNARGFRLVQAMDAVAILAILVLSTIIRFGWDWPAYGGGREGAKGAYVVSFLVITLIFLLAFYFGGLYDREPRLGRPPVLPRAARLGAGATGIVAVGNLAFTGVLNSLGNTTERALPLPTYLLGILLVLPAVAVAANRQFTTWNERRLLGTPRALLIGTPDEVAKARQHLAVEEGPDGATDGDAEVEIIATTDRIDDLLGLVDRHDVTDVILLSGRWLGQVPPTALKVLDRRDVVIHQRVSALETMYGLQRVRQIGGMPFVKLRAHTLPTSRLRFKRFMDLIWLALLSPFVVLALAFTALYTLAVAGRPILYRQARVGIDGSHFRLVKFRTMRPDAEAQSGAVWAEKEDPRVIPACRWLRATRLDELPQVANILRGEMSLVGPRPERPELTAHFEAEFPNYARRHEVPPGLTGLAQIHGRYHTDPEYKLGHDLQYLVNWSPILDLEILARTVWVVLARRV